MTSTAFYRNLKAANSLSDAFSEGGTAPLPSDWYVVVTDIVGSTAAITAGRYKDVNTAGGLAAMAMSNAFKTLEFPFVFGGDGTTFLIPATMRDETAGILADTARKVKDFFDLDLRVGIVPAIDVYAKNFAIRVGKIQVSEHYIQAVILGDGIDYAESLVKTTPTYLVAKNLVGATEANFFGFTCRWHDIPSHGGETVALIVRLNNANDNSQRQLLRSILEQIEKIYGPENEHHPIREKNMKPALTPRVLWREAAATANRKSGIMYYLSFVRIIFESVGLSVIMALKLPGKKFHFELKRIKWYNVVSADYKKFDGMLKLVISGSSAMREKLVAELDRLKREGKLLYGIHVSNRALMTCLLNADSAHEVHFVDAADGGYALAAKMLKEQLSAQG